jgi:hypothetical protein
MPWRGWAGRLEPRYEELAVQLRESPLVHSDEMSWWIAGPGW